jgi:hypothetical protein
LADGFPYVEWTGGNLKVLMYFVRASGWVNSCIVSN